MTPEKSKSNGVQAISSITIAISIGVVVVISNVIFIPIVWNEITSSWNQLEQQLRDIEAIRSAIKESLDVLPTVPTRRTRESARQRLDDETVASSRRRNRIFNRRRQLHKKENDAERQAFGVATHTVAFRDSNEMRHSGMKRHCTCSLENKCPAGPRGPPGQRGEDGTPGRAGEPGLRGADSMDITTQHFFTGCLICPAGPDGPPGEQGQIGIPGPRGPPGNHGLPGRNGAPGSPGDIGLSGKPGKKGKPGAVGQRGMNGMVSEGSPGAKGKRGPPGPRGEPGDDGDPNSEESVIGPEGRTGAPGLPGKKGTKGKPGMIGLPGIPGISPECDCKQIIRAHSPPVTQRHLRVHSLESKDQDVHLEHVLNSLKAIKVVDEGFKDSDSEEEAVPEEGSGERTGTESIESEQINSDEDQLLINRAQIGSQLGPVATTSLPENHGEDEEGQQENEESEESTEAEESAGNEGSDNLNTVISTEAPVQEVLVKELLATDLATLNLTLEGISKPRTTITVLPTSTTPAQESSEIYDTLVKVPARKPDRTIYIDRNSQLGTESRVHQRHPNTEEPFNIDHRYQNHAPTSKIDSDSGDDRLEAEEAEEINNASKRPPFLEVSAERSGPAQPKSRPVATEMRPERIETIRRMIDMGLVFAARERARQRMLQQKRQLERRRRLEQYRSTATKSRAGQKQSKKQSEKYGPLKGRLPKSKRPVLVAAPVYNRAINLFNTLPNGVYTKSAPRAVRPPLRAFGPPLSHRRVHIPLVTPIPEDTPAPTEPQDRLYAVENELKSVVDERIRSSSEQTSSEKQGKSDGKADGKRIEEIRLGTSDRIHQAKEEEVAKELETETVVNFEEIAYAIPVELQPKIARNYGIQEETGKVEGDVNEEQNPKGEDEDMISSPRGRTSTLNEQSANKSVSTAHINVIEYALPGINVLPTNEMTSPPVPIADLGHDNSRNHGRKRINILLGTDSQILPNFYTRNHPHSQSGSENVIVQKHVAFVDRVSYLPLTRARAVISDINTPGDVRVKKTKSSESMQSKMMVDEGRQGYLKAGMKLVRISTGNSARKQSSGKRKKSLRISRRKSRIALNKKRVAKLTPRSDTKQKIVEKFNDSRNSLDSWKVQRVRI